MQRRRAGTGAVMMLFAVASHVQMEGNGDGMVACHVSMPSTKVKAPTREGQMGTHSGKLSSGESYFFDKDSKSLFVINSGEQCSGKADAEKLVASGKATIYTKHNLENIQSAFKHIVLLG